MRLQPIPVTLREYGNAVGFVIPRPLALILGLEAGQKWSANLGTGKPLTLKVRVLGGQALGVTIPAEERRRRGLEAGAQLEVPLAQWKRLPTR